MKHLYYNSGDYSNLSTEDRQFYIDLIKYSDDQSTDSFNIEEQEKLCMFFLDMCNHIKNKLKQVYNDTYVIISIDDFIINGTCIDEYIECVSYFDNVFNIHLEDGSIAEIINIDNIIDDTKVDNYIKEYLISKAKDTQNELDNIYKRITYLKHRRNVLNCYIETNYKE